MAVNPNIEPPTFVAITKSDTVLIHPTLRGVDLWAAGTFRLGDVLGNVYGPYTIAAPFPVRITGQINRVYATTDGSTSATIGNSDIVGLQ